MHPQGKDSTAAYLFSLCAGGTQSPKRISDFLYRPVRPAGTHAYMITKQGAKKLLKACPKARFHIDIDAWGQRSVDVLMFNPMLAYQTFDSSTLVEYRKGNENTENSILQRVFKNSRDPFTRQTWQHALSEPLLQLGARAGGPVLRNYQVVAVCGGGLLLATLSHFLQLKRSGNVILKATMLVIILLKILISLLLKLEQ